jgi:anti-sigma factor RsiW
MNDRNSLLVAYADGELELELAQQAERLIAADPQARATVEMYRETAALLRAACGEEFYKRDVAFLSAASRPTNQARLRHGLALAASLVMAIAAGFGGGTMWASGTTSERAELLAEVAGYHAIYSHETRHLVEVPAEQVDHLKAWLGQRLARSLDVPDLTPAGLHFAGGRMTIINGRPVAQLMYTRDQGLPIGLCLTRMTGGPSSISVEQRGALQLASWEDGSYEYVVVGEMDAPAARNIAERVKVQLKA